MRQLDLTWYGPDRLAAEIHQSQIDARRRAAKRRRENRREWLKLGAVAVFVVGCGYLFFWVLAAAL